ncbi:hypothetical protein BC351_40520 [Paenibacillus ferrarius]|uniref:Uncharacterized protein n=1 Tax=Paenibacillus ferrarius TaxID=1469647 RepID=A0A1V4H783_9BACL|nr:hypothetical protein [Paenibacillus ferrarius]OPH47006.1 hypothetical protein BC351_40520 [Paenibacillus ferrarius]
MGQNYVLINKSKKELIGFTHLPAGKARELAGNPVTAAITTWYLLQNSGDNILFVEEERIEEGFADVTNDVIEMLIQNGILQDNGIEVFDEDEPNIYMRRLENNWMK